MLALRLIRSRNNRKRCNIFDCLQIRQFGVLLFRYDRRIYRPADDRFIKTLPDGVFMCKGLTTDLTDTVRIKYTCAIHCMSTHGTGSLVNPHAVFGSLGCIGIQMGFFFYNAAACTTDFFTGRIISGIMISGTAFCLFFVDISTEDTYGTVHSCSGDLFPAVELMIAGDLRFWCCRLRCWCRCRHWGWSGRRW